MSGRRPRRGVRAGRGNRRGRDRLGRLGRPPWCSTTPRRRGRRRRPRSSTCINAAAEARRPLLLTARAPAARWPVALPDLASRLAATLVVDLPPPDDALLSALLAKHFADRQVAPPPALIPFLALRIERSAAAALDAVSRLDSRRNAREGARRLRAPRKGGAAASRWASGHARSRHDRDRFPSSAAFPGCHRRWTDLDHLRAGQRFFNRELSWLSFNWRVARRGGEPPRAAAGTAAVPVDLARTISMNSIPCGWRACASWRRRATPPPPPTG